MSDMEALQLVKRQMAHLHDELEVKTQVAVCVANMLSKSQRLASQLAESVSAKDEELVTLRALTTSLKEAAESSDLPGKLAAAQKRLKERDAECATLTARMGELQASMEKHAAIDAEVVTLRAERIESQQRLEEWKTKVKEALKENRKKEQQQVQTEIELRAQIKNLTEQLDAAKFKLESTALLHAPKSRVTVECQTDQISMERRCSPLVDGQGPPHVSTSHMSPAPQEEDAGSPGGVTLPQRPPFVVTVHYVTTQGWTVDTKLKVSGTMTVMDVLRTVCERFSQRQGIPVNSAVMCLRTMHERTKRMVTLSEGREFHSFSYFQKCQRDGVQITLLLEERANVEPGSAQLMSPGGFMSPLEI